MIRGIYVNSVFIKEIIPFKMSNMNSYIFIQHGMYISGCACVYIYRCVCTHTLLRNSQ